VTTEPGLEPTAAVCPLCGNANECGVAAGAASCWCFTAVIPDSVLARVPPDQRNRTCVCRQCAGAALETGTPGRSAGNT